MERRLFLKSAMAGSAVATAVGEALTSMGTFAPFSAILGALNLKEPLPALVAFDTAVFDKPLNLAEAAKTVDGVSKPAPTAVATAEPAIALFKNNLLSILNATSTGKGSFKFKAPKIAENGAKVPMEVNASKMSDVTNIYITI
jgi:hypothetical protein